MDYRLRPGEHLNKAREFSAVFERGKRFRGTTLTLVAAPNGLAHSRVGVIASRRVGGAVKRNRAKRLMREAFRLNRHLLERRLDVIMIASPRAPDCSPADIGPDVRQLFGEINEAIGSG